MTSVSQWGTCKTEITPETHVQNNDCTAYSIWVNILTGIQKVRPKKSLSLFVALSDAYSSLLIAKYNNLQFTFKHLKIMNTWSIFVRFARHSFVNKLHFLNKWRIFNHLTIPMCILLQVSEADENQALHKKGCVVCKVRTISWLL